jgi:hypothetical protein
MKPRHLFVKKVEGPDHWLVLIGNIGVGSIRRTSMFNFVPNRGWLPKAERMVAATMEATKLRLYTEAVPKELYEEILDKAYKQNGYKG